MGYKCFFFLNHLNLTRNVLTGIHFILLRQTISMKFSISGITPSAGSLVGGSTLTVTGSGLDDNTHVMIGDRMCKDVISSPDGTSLQCTTTYGGARHRVDNTGTHPSEFEFGFNMIILQICAFTYLQPHLCF